MNDNRQIADIPESLAQQIKILEKSKFYTWIIVISVLISIQNIDIQKRDLINSALCGKECASPELFTRKIGANIMVLAALFFFYCITSEGAKAAGGKNCSANLNQAASGLTLMAGLIRLTDLMKNQSPQ